MPNLRMESSSTIVMEWVKLNKSGHPYIVGPDGFKKMWGSPRPKDDYSPAEWRSLSTKERAIAIRRVEMEKDAKKSKEETDAIIKRRASQDEKKFVGDGKKVAKASGSKDKPSDIDDGEAW